MVAKGENGSDQAICVSYFFVCFFRGLVTFAVVACAPVECAWSAAEGCRSQVCVLMESEATRHDEAQQVSNFYTCQPVRRLVARSPDVAVPLACS